MAGPKACQRRPTEADLTFAAQLAALYFGVVRACPGGQNWR